MDVLTATTDEKKEIQRAYRQMVKAIRSEVTKEDKKNLKLAFDMANEAHARQRRKSGEPYILHPIEVGAYMRSRSWVGAYSYH